MDARQVADVLAKIAYKDDWKLAWGLDMGEEILLFQWRVLRPDSRTGEIGIGDGGKNYVMIDDLDEESLVRRVFSAALAYEEHECREFFTYDGQRPFDPHVKLIRETVDA